MSFSNIRMTLDSADEVDEARIVGLELGEVDGWKVLLNNINCYEWAMNSQST